MTPLLIHDVDGARRLTLNRPEQRNALSQELLHALEAAQQDISKDPTVRVVVLAGAGPVFCAGHDLKEMQGCDETRAHDLFALCSRVMLGFRKLPQPVIARVHGLATAAGCQLACAADMIVAADEAAFATPGVKIGLFCTTPMVPLVRALAPKVALEMLFTGNPLPARRAFELGLVNRLVPTTALGATIADLVATMSAYDSRTLALGKTAFYEHLELSEESAYEQATSVMAKNAVRDDAVTGIAGFLKCKR
jgi:enoyl-CoA hydratase/carnithine racemase